MRDTYVVRAGRSKYGSVPDESYRSLFRTAVENTMASVDGEVTARRGSRGTGRKRCPSDRSEVLGIAPRRQAFLRAA